RPRRFAAGKGAHPVVVETVGMTGAEHIVQGEGGTLAAPVARTGDRLPGAPVVGREIATVGGIAATGELGDDGVRQVPLGAEEERRLGVSSGYGQQMPGNTTVLAPRPAGGIGSGQGHVDYLLIGGVGQDWE